MDEISALRLFVNVVEAGGISAAARNLEASPAAISRGLAALEKRLGVRLVTRTSRRFDLTDEGRLFFERSSSIVQDIDAAEAEIAAASDQPRGLIRVVAPMGFGAAVVAPLAREFAELHPQIGLRLILSDAGPDITDPIPDLMLTTRLPASSGMISRKIHSDRRIVCATPDYLARHGRPHTPQELLQHNCLCLVRGSDIFDHWQFRQGHRTISIKVSGRMAANSTAVLREWVLEGQGIGFLAMWDIYDAVQKNLLEECLFSYWCDTIDLYALYPTRQHLPHRIRIFIDFLMSRLSMFHSFSPRSIADSSDS